MILYNMRFVVTLLLNIFTPKRFFLSKYLLIIFFVSFFVSFFIKFVVCFCNKVGQVFLRNYKSVRYPGIQVVGTAIPGQTHRHIFTPF